MNTWIPLRARHFLLATCAALLLSPIWLHAGTPTKDAAVPAAEIAKKCGRLEHIGELRVLSLRGSPRERGVAHGYLLGAEIFETMRQYLDDSRLSGGPDVYEKVSAAYVGLLLMPGNPAIEEELAGMIEGMKARLGNGGMVVPALKRPVDLRDLRAIQFAADAAPRGCSSFAAWGKRTSDGATLAGRNLDWFGSTCVVGHGVVIVQAADTERKRQGWVSLTWPGAIGCYTAMNESGMTLAIHDVSGRSIKPSLDISPRPLVLREVIERSRAETAGKDVPRVLREHHVLVGTNLAVTVPGKVARVPAMVVEFDGRRADGGGVTMRRPESGGTWQVCTNHYRSRGDDAVADTNAGQCIRYDGLMKALGESSAPLDVAGAWKLLDAVSMNGKDTHGIVTLQSVVFEPDAMRMHVFFAQPDRPAAKRRATTLDVRKALGPS